MHMMMLKGSPVPTVVKVFWLCVAVEYVVDFVFVHARSDAILAQIFMIHTHTLRISRSACGAEYRAQYFTHRVSYIAALLLVLDVSSTMHVRACAL